MTTQGPLAGITVLDVSRILAGPFCTMILGDLGAEVIKVEPPTGDDTRSWGPPFVGSESAYYLSTNRNKKGIVLDLKNSQDKERLLKLARKADVFIENFRLGVAESLGIDYESIKAVNQNIIYCSIKAFGSKGPYAAKPGLDIVIQAYGGFMGITGTRRGTPVRVGVAITDLTSGLYAVIGILSALFWRNKSSEGQFVELSLLDCSVSL
ncbi:MAG: CaiB/BaiF CoA transferase family protein, partial [Candidatus Bathyarchaeia archaeon]